MKWLSKEWDTDQKTIELIMTADKQAQQQWFEQLEQEDTDFLILDRYTTSQTVYSIANGIDPDWTEELQKYMRRTDVEILIDIPAEESMRRKGKHNNGENDRYESDLQLLNRVRQGYLHYFRRPNHFIIDGLQQIEQVHLEIVKSLKPFKIE